MQWEYYARAMLLHARLPLLQRRIESGLSLLRAYFKETKHPYVAFSGGKDSLVALDLSLQVEPDVEVVWHDEDWVIPGTLETLRRVETHYKINILRVRERKSADEFYAKYGQFPVCSNPRGVDFEADTWAEIVAHFGFDGAIVALRSDESVARWYAMRKPLKQIKADQSWRCSPVHNWSVDDVWAYILSRNLPYHTAYPQLINAGIAPKYARVGPFTAVRVYEFGSLAIIKHLWRDAWREFVLENPCVQSET